MGRRGRGMGGGRPRGGMGGSRRSGGFRPGIGGGRGRSGRGGASRGPGSGQFGGGRYYRPRRRGFGSVLPWFLLGSMGGRRRGPHRGGGGCGGCGCLIPIIIILILGIIFANNNTPNQGQYNQGPQVEVRDSTQEREPIEEGLVNETDYYSDQANWITNESELIDGMETFYELTNIQPYLYITESINGETDPDIEEVQAYTDNLYDELFTDEAHLLVVFFENDNYSETVSYHASVGEDASQIFDEEAQGILFDYLDYYYYSDMSEEDYFSTAFERTAQDMMQTSSGIFTSSSSEDGLNWSGIFIGVALFLLVLGIIIFIFNRRQKSQEAEIIDPDDDLTF